MSATRKSRRTILEVEALESRVVLDGSVTAFLNGAGDLIVQGDDAGNSVRIDRSAGPGSPIQVSGGADTAINGVLGGTAVIGSVLNIDVRLGGGNDRISVDAVDVPGAVLMVLGDGDDSADFHGRLGAVEVRGGDGNDDIDLSSGVEVFGYARIQGGEGDDYIAIMFTPILGQLDINAGGGSNILRLFSVQVDEGVTIQTGEGDDNVALDFVIVQGDTMIKLGAGDDDLRLDTLAVQGDTLIKLGAGDDSLYLRDSVCLGLFFASGGDGTDDIEDVGGNTFTDALFLGFES
jgi:hypothetical protein